MVTIRRARCRLIILSAACVLLLPRSGAAQARGGARRGGGSRGGGLSARSFRGAGGISRTGHGIRNTGFGFRGLGSRGVSRAGGRRSGISGFRSGSRSSGGLRFGIGRRSGGVNLSDNLHRHSGSSSFSIGFSSGVGSGFGFGRRSGLHRATVYAPTSYYLYDPYASGRYYDSTRYVYPADYRVATEVAPQPVAPPPAEPEPTPVELKQARELGNALGRGDKAFERGDYQDAREEYVRALVLARDDPRARIALGLAEFARGRYSDAARALRAGVARVPQIVDTSFDLTRAYGVPDDFAGHREALESHLRSDESDADAWFVAGFVRFFGGDRPGGLAAFDRYQSLAESDDAAAPFIARARENANKS